MRAAVYVTRPGVLINKRRSFVEISFDEIDPQSLKSVGKNVRLRMSTLDGMTLLALLRTIQEKYCLPAVVGEPDHIEVPSDAAKH